MQYKEYLRVTFGGIRRKENRNRSTGKIRVLCSVKPNVLIDTYIIRLTYLTVQNRFNFACKLNDILRKPCEAVKFEIFLSLYLIICRGKNDVRELDKPTEQTAKRKMRRQIVWRNAVGFPFSHLTTLYGFFVSLPAAKLLIWV
jgi:hypothetical protein